MPRKKPKSMTVMSVKYLRERGFIVTKVEQTIPYTFIKRDAFGFGDLLISKPGWGTALVQVTSMNNLAARQLKAERIKELWIWLESSRFLLHGWAKRGPRGHNKQWTLTEREVKL